MDYGLSGFCLLPCLLGALPPTPWHLTLWANSMEKRCSTTSKRHCGMSLRAKRSNLLPIGLRLLCRYAPRNDIDGFEIVSLGRDAMAGTLSSVILTRILR